MQRNNNAEVDSGTDSLYHLFFTDILVDESDKVLENIDKMLKVNNEIVDNELGGTDLAVSVDWNKVGIRRPSKWMRTGEVELCSARWGAAFLCKFGHYSASSPDFIASED